MTGLFQPQCNAIEEIRINVAGQRHYSPDTTTLKTTLGFALFVAGSMFEAIAITPTLTFQSACNTHPRVFDFNEDGIPVWRSD